MIRKILLSSIPIFFLFNLFIVSAQSITNIELLDIEKNKIVKTTPTNPKIQVEAEKIIKEIDNVVKKLNPIPEDEEPYLLIFDDENKSYFFTFETKIDTLLNTLDFSL